MLKKSSDNSRNGRWKTRRSSWLRNLNYLNNGKMLQEAFDIMGFEDQETHDLYSNVAGIMHMGEMKFKQRPREEQAEPDGDEGDFADHFQCTLTLPHFHGITNGSFDAVLVVWLGLRIRASTMPRSLSTFLVPKHWKRKSEVYRFRVHTIIYSTCPAGFVKILPKSRTVLQHSLDHSCGQFSSSKKKEKKEKFRRQECRFLFWCWSRRILESTNETTRSCRYWVG